LRGILFIFDVYFLRCLIKLRHLAETEQMTSKEHIVVHFARVHFSVPRLKWDRVEQMINKELVEHGVDVIVYSRDKNDAHRISQNK
jgi:diphthamide biosynthesis methyltransferase